MKLNIANEFDNEMNKFDSENKKYEKIALSYKEKYKNICKNSNLEKKELNLNLNTFKNQIEDLSKLNFSIFFKIVVKFF